MDSGQEEANKAGEAQRQEAAAFLGTPQAAGLPTMVGTGAGAPPPAAPNLDMSLPLTDRLNNPGALKFAGQPGAINVNGFAMFPTREAGMAAADSNLAGYAGHGINTLSGAITRWAPPTENNTEAYIRYMAEKTGLDPNAQIDLTDKAIRDRILPHLTSYEGGPRSVASGGAQPPSGAPGMAAPPPGGGASPAGGVSTGTVPTAAGGAPRASALADTYLQQALGLQQRALAAATSTNPMIRQAAPQLAAQAQLYATLAKERPQIQKVGPGEAIVDPTTGRTLFSQPALPRQPVTVQLPDGRWVHEDPGAAVGKTAPTPGPSITIDQRGANEEAQTRGKSLATAAEAIRNEARESARIVDETRTVRNIGAETGRLAPAKEVVGSWLEALGVKNVKAVNDATNLQALNGAISSLVLGQQLLQKGVQTEGDAARIRESYATATNTMAANDILLRATEGMAMRKMEQSDFFEKWYGEHKTYDGASSAWNKFIRETPLTIKGANGVQFLYDFLDYAKNNGVDPAAALDEWKARAARK